MDYPDPDLIGEDHRRYDLVKRMADVITKARQAAQEAQDGQCIQWDRMRSPMPDFPKGSMVLLLSDGLLLAKFRKFPRHLVPRWFGPFKVISENQSPNFTLELPSITMSRVHNVFHGSLLKAYHDPVLPQFPNRDIVQPMPVRQNEDGDEEYEIESIIRKDFI